MVSKVVRTSPAKVASSRAGRTSPVSKVVSNAKKMKGPAHRRAFFLCREVTHNLCRFRLLIDRAFGDLS